jgi:hypothetical protein
MPLLALRLFSILLNTDALVLTEIITEGLVPAALRTLSLAELLSVLSAVIIDRRQGTVHK